MSSTRATAVSAMSLIVSEKPSPTPTLVPLPPLEPWRAALPATASILESFVAVRESVLPVPVVLSVLLFACDRVLFRVSLIEIDPARLPAMVPLDESATPPTAPIARLKIVAAETAATVIGPPASIVELSTSAATRFSWAAVPICVTANEAPKP